MVHMLYMMGGCHSPAFTGEVTGTVTTGQAQQE